MLESFFFSVFPSMLSDFVFSIRCCLRCSASCSFCWTTLTEQSRNSKCYSFVWSCSVCKCCCWQTCRLCVNHQVVCLPHSTVGFIHDKRRVLQLLSESLQLKQWLLNVRASCCSLILSPLQWQDWTWGNQSAEINLLHFLSEYYNRPYISSLTIRKGLQTIEWFIEKVAEVKNGLFDELQSGGYFGDIQLQI